MSVRVRFAPSPTGDLHIGGARTALYNLLLARRLGGIHLLRIEDTDQARNTPQALQSILDALRWLGIGWDEGPVHQSARLEIYRDWGRRLEATGTASWRDDPGKGRALVFRNPGGRIAWVDAVHGETSRDISGDPDLVCLKADGFPTYNFACVVDDLDMRITHVLRGDDHLANTPKQLALYAALGHAPPPFAPLPLILNPDGSKMSKDYKKKGGGGREIEIPTHVLRYRDLGYLPEALRNFLALLGWAPGDDREVLTFEAMTAAFDLGRVSHGGARFDIAKLDWMNGVYIRALPGEVLAERVRPFVAARGIEPARVTPALADGLRRNLATLSDFPLKAQFALVDEITYDPSAVQRHLAGREGMLREIRAALGQLTEFTPSEIEAAVIPILTLHGGVKVVGQALRVALTGGVVSPELITTVALIGRERACARLAAAAALAPAGGGGGCRAASSVPPPS